MFTMLPLGLNRKILGSFCKFCKRYKLTRNARTFSTSSSNGTTRDNETYDVVISGGGMVGLAMACALGHEDAISNKRILLLESAPQKDFQLLEQFSNRVSAISPGSVKLLSSFGAWEEIVGMRAHQVARLQVWEECSDSMITFNNNDMTEPVSYIVENDVTVEAITRQLQKVKDRVEVRYKTSAKAYDLPKPVSSEGFNNPSVKILLNDDSSVSARLLIGADGIHSGVRKAAGLSTVGWEYNQWAVVATLHLPEPMENNVAWQRFVKNGPIALLPLSDNRTSLVWTTTPEEAKMLCSLAPEAFVDALNTALWDESKKDDLAVRVGEMFQQILKSTIPGGPSVGQLPPTISGVDDNRAMFPLGLRHSNHYVQHRMALIGDSAHRIHPLAGQGVNLGFGDVAALTRILAKTAASGGDIGSLTHLLEYETERQRRVIPTMAAMDGLNRLYGTRFSPVVLLRSLGLQATNALTPLKEQFMKFASN